VTRRFALAAATLAAAVLLALPAPARAGWGVIDLELGAKGIAGANLWTDPSDLPAYLLGQDWAFDKARAGWSAGAGIYAQLRVLKFLGLEVDFLVEEGQLKETPLDGHTWTLTAWDLHMRIPILLQGILPLPGVRIGVGLGPEFVIPLKTEARQANRVPYPDDYANYDFRIQEKVSTLLAMGINITPVIAKHYTIPIDIRASYNLTQPKGYEGRVAVHTRTSGVKDLSKGFTLRLQDTWDFRLLLGFGYAF
jgi:hypothetical protein